MSRSSRFVPHNFQEYLYGHDYVQEILFEVVTRRFSAINQRPVTPGTYGGPLWAYDPDPGKTGIFVQAQYSELDDTSNVSPLVSITTGMESLVDIGIVGDRGGDGSRAWMHGAAVKHHYLGIDAGLVCVGQTRAESAMIAQIIFEMLVSCRHELAAAFGFHDVFSPTLSSTEPSSRYVGHFETRIATRFVWERTVDIQPYLKWDVDAVRLRVVGRLQINATPTGDPQDTNL